jgi:hypothetical protein
MTRLASIVRYRWSLLLSIAVGLLAAPVLSSVVGGVVAQWWAEYDAANPIVVMQGEVVTADVDEVVVRLWGKKSDQRAGECRYVRLLAYTRSLDGVLHDAFIRRVDMPETGQTKPPGSHAFGTWRVWPTPGAVAVLVHVLHDCAGRQVRTKALELPI